MTMEDFTLSAELDQMRSEYATLKKKFDEQEIINSKLIVNSVKTKVDSLDRHERFEYVACAFAALLSPVYHYTFNASWWFCLGTVVFMLFCGYKTWLEHRNVKAYDVRSKDMLSVAKNVRKLRQDYTNWLNVALPLLVVWLGWLFAELMMNNDDKKFVILMAGSIICGLLIGGSIGLSMRRKVIRTCDEIIAQIEEN